MMMLSEKVYDAINESIPKKLKSGQWHVPFLSKINTYKLLNEYLNEYDIDKSWLEHYTVKVATALAAKTSYTSIGDEQKINYVKLLNLHDRLLKMKHMSPFEHCARAMSNEEYNSFIKGEICDFPVMDKSSRGWCRNFKGFIPYRHIIESL